MDFVEQMQVFTRVAELSSFTQAADGLGLTKAAVSTAVQRLENRLGVRLLHRTTRNVVLSHDGKAFYDRCKDSLADIDELQAMFRQHDASMLKGRVRLDMTTVLAHQVVIPRLPELVQRYPQLQIEVGSTERFVDLVREGYDCVVRAGKVTGAGLVTRPLGEIQMRNCASPAYIARCGMPHTLDDLARHQLVHFASTLGARSVGFEYQRDGATVAVAMQGPVTVNNAESYQAACLAGLGIAQIPSPGVRNSIASGQLVDVLPQWRAPPMPLALVYAHRRNLSARVRIVMDWLHGVLAEHLREPATPAEVPAAVGARRARTARLQPR